MFKIANHRYQRSIAGMLSLLLVQLTSPPLLAADNASAVQQHQYAIPAGSLTQALNHFAQDAGIVLSFDPQLTLNKSSNGIQGKFSVEEGFSRLLEGSGVTFYKTSDQGYGLKKVPLPPTSDNAAPDTLPEVRVRAAAEKNEEKAWSPVEGFVAKRSATANKIDSKIIETPNSISVVTADQMEAQQVKTITQSLRYTPGITAEIAGPQFMADQLLIRGFQQSTGRLLRDGNRTFLANYLGWDAPEPFGLERVEVMRGASSVLYGSSDPGGQINLVTKRPPLTPLHHIQLQAGSFDYKQAAFDFGGPVDDAGVVSYRLTGLIRDSSAQTDYIKNERTFIAPAITIRPSEQTEITFLAEYQKQKGNFANPLPAQGTALSNPNGRISRDRYIGEPNYDKSMNEKVSAGYILDHAFNDVWTFRQNLRFSHYRHDSREVAFLGWADPELTTANRYAEERNGSGNLFTVDNQVQAKFATGSLNHTLLTGLDFSRASYKQDQSLLLGTSLNLFNPVYGNLTLFPFSTVSYEQTVKQTGVYLQDQIKINNWVAVVGGRQDWVRDENDAAFASKPVAKDHKFSGRAGLLYLFDNGFAPYVSYSESFLPVAGRTFTQEVFKPEEGKQYEIGLKYEPPQSNSLYSIAAFDLTKENVSIPDPAHSGNNIQEGEIRSRGIELEAKTSITRKLNVLGSYTWNDVEVTKAEAGIKGNTPFRVPEHMASIWVDYMPSGVLAGLNIGGGVRYVGSSAGDRENSFKVDSYTVVDALVRYDLENMNAKFKGFRVSLNAMNLLDKRFVAGCFSMNGCQYGQQQTIFATVDYKW
ncbi:TonB-dependent siderophore receptor [Methylovorus menthalis]|uniref:TonB-dependent siderophore receptor n=1 Tax=Methylovorus menthalis TaxID=1002227 RepID=UPI001E46B913|nr:TonB-dependent siderophore receptor [Methylovorus menthalis]MCB4811184.1 TonB-dependent siderophore receptor [Methylovorus menthalis]